METSTDSANATRIRLSNYKPNSKQLEQFYDNSEVLQMFDFSRASGMDAIIHELESMGTQEINVIPRKPNYDLKRSVEGKLKLLRKKTQKVIVEHLRSKLEERDE
jgi:coiled-coil domain-containing protein 12